MQKDQKIKVILSHIEFKATLGYKRLSQKQTSKQKPVWTHIWKPKNRQEYMWEEAEGLQSAGWDKLLAVLYKLRRTTEVEKTQRARLHRKVVSTVETILHAPSPCTGPTGERHRPVLLAHMEELAS